MPSPTAKRRQILAGCRRAKVACAVSLASRRGLAAVQHRGRLGRQHDLGLVDLRAVERFQPRDLVERQVGEQPQELADIGVGGVPPELPVIVGAELVAR